MYFIVSVLTCTVVLICRSFCVFYSAGVSLSFEVGGSYRRAAGEKITLEVNFFVFSLKMGRYWLFSLVYPGTGATVLLNLLDAKRKLIELNLTCQIKNCSVCIIIIILCAWKFAVTWLVNQNLTFFFVFLQISIFMFSYLTVKDCLVPMFCIPLLISYSKLYFSRPDCTCNRVVVSNWNSLKQFNSYCFVVPVQST